MAFTKAYRTVGFQTLFSGTDRAHRSKFAPIPLVRRAYLPSAQRLLADSAFQLEPVDLNYGIVAAAVEINAIYSRTPPLFSEAMNNAAGLLGDDFMRLVDRNRAVLDAMIDGQRDTYFSL